MRKTNYFTRGELALWSGSMLLIVTAFMMFDRGEYLTLAASITGVTSLIFSAKGNPFGQFLMIIFSLLYGIISYSFNYFGEMITYLGMTGPMALFSLISWLRNPYKGNRAQVKVKRLHLPEYIFMALLSGAVTLLFFYILRAFSTANLIPSTLSVTTSFIAVYLTFRRSPYYALAYAANDALLIYLWLLASMSDSSYISVLVCFVVFLVNDLYGLVCWRKMEKIQKS